MNTYVVMYRVRMIFGAGGHLVRYPCSPKKGLCTKSDYSISVRVPSLIILEIGLNRYDTYSIEENVA
jgi:hypothetical protein